MASCCAGRDAIGFVVTAHREEADACVVEMLCGLGAHGFVGVVAGVGEVTHLDDELDARLR